MLAPLPDPWKAETIASTAAKTLKSACRRLFLTNKNMALTSPLPTVIRKTVSPTQLHLADDRLSLSQEYL